MDVDFEKETVLAIFAGWKWYRGVPTWTSSE
jgi:hypothetical protein